jgi:hypothetical protein
MRSFILCSLTNITGANKQRKMGWSDRKPDEKRPLEDPGIDRRILDCILMKYGRRVWVGFI